jgi:hypothetical protein
VSSEAVTANRLYPVIAYDINLDDDIVTYQIVDDSRSLSKRKNDRFEVISYSKEGYIKVDGDNGFLKYLYKDLSDKDFFVDYYSENEKSILANKKLENTLISILSHELDSNELLSYLEMVGYQDENSELLLRAFFLKAKENDIIRFSTVMYDKISMLNNYLVEIIIRNLSNYKAKEIENIFMELYINNTSYSEKVMERISNYLNI